MKKWSVVSGQENLEPIIAPSPFERAGGEDEKKKYLIKIGNYNI